jgi:hypothetical protein
LKTEQRHSEPYADTDPRVMEVWLDRLRRMPPGEKLSTVFSLNKMAWNMAEMGVRLAHPQASDREIFLRVAARRLSRDLMIRMYGWDPGDL